MVQLTGLEPRRSDLARGIVIVRGTRPLDDAEQRALWEVLARAGVTEVSETEDERGEARQWLAAPWLPPSASQLDGQRAAVEQAAAAFALDAVWFVKVETGIDGVAWLELAASEPAAGDEDDEADDEAAGSTEIVDAIFEEQEVLYAAPDAPAAADDDVGADADEDDDDDDGDGGFGVEAELEMESHWRNGPPPFEHAVAFPIERYPEILEDYDWDRFGVAMKLAGAALPGEEAVINAFFALWLSVYQDERADEFEAFQRADVVHDRRHRAALMWVERFAVPATASDQVHFLLWIVARIHEVLPIAWARFEDVDDAVKARADTSEDRGAFILAGNPFAERFRRHGEEAALLWAVGQSAWSRRELAGMLIEVALAHDPDEPSTSAIAERLLRRALVFDPASDATGYLAIVLVRQGRLADAIALAREADSRDVRLLVVGEIAERAPRDAGAALALLDRDTVEATDPEELADLAAGVARHAPASLADLLAVLPERAALVPYLYNASFTVERPQALVILRKVLALPEPAPDAGEARTALVMAWNNACIHAHALGDYRLAVELADGGQRFGAENPYIYHSAACAYAAVGAIDRALEQVRLAIANDYEHTEKMETDVDLAPLQQDPRFGALFADWRNQRADLN